MANKKLRVFKNRLRARLAMNRMKNMKRKGPLPKSLRNYMRQESKDSGDHSPTPPKLSDVQMNYPDIIMENSIDE